MSTKRPRKHRSTRNSSSKNQSIRLPGPVAILLIAIFLGGLILFIQQRVIFAPNSSSPENWAYWADIGLEGPADVVRPPDEPLIRAAAKHEGLEASLVLAVIRQESNFNPNATSRVGARGLMQIMPETGDEIAKMMKRTDPFDLYDKSTNLAFGTYYLRYLLKRFDGVRSTALAAYNAGPTVVRSWLNDPSYSEDGRTLKAIPYKETRNYVKNVLRFYEAYRKDLQK